MVAETVLLIHRLTLLSPTVAYSGPETAGDMQCNGPGGSYFSPGLALLSSSK